MATLPTNDYRRTALPARRELPRGLDAVAWHAAGIRRRLGAQRQIVAGETAALIARERLRADKDSALAVRLEDLRADFRRKFRDDRLPEAIAAVALAAERQLGLRAHAVQLRGALALLQGTLAEMATGEGKTLVVGLAAAVAGWSGRPCHVLTANDYLAARDAEWLGPFFRRCGASVGCVVGGDEPPARRAAYACDITYTTSREVLADLLRDRLRLGKLQDASRRHLRLINTPGGAEQLGLTLRGLHCALVDEADQLLIDEAVTPLIISQPRANAALHEAVRAAQQCAGRLTKDAHYRAHGLNQDVELLASAEAEMCDEDEGLPEALLPARWRRDLVRQALLAREFFHRDRQYVIDEGRVQIVDEATGRLMPDRSWRQGLHQAIEEKEGVAMTDPAETVARLSFQRFFRLYPRLAGLSGTAREATSELWFTYGLPVVRIPTNRPIQRIEAPDQVFRTLEEKWGAIADEITRRHALGQPLLVGTRSVETSETLSARLAARGLRHEVLNAVRHREEAGIISRAGETGRITVATNMAGRGTDIRLAPPALAAGGLHVLATERHFSRRVDRQLFGRAGRQGDPGSAQAFLSLEDELFTRCISAPVRRGLATVCPARVCSAYAARAQRSTQARAAAQRRALMLADTWEDEALGFAGAAS